MSDYLEHRINKPKHFKIAHLNGSRTQRRHYVIGFDSESEQVDKPKGYPFLYQFAHPDGRVDLLDVPIGNHYESLFTFLDYLHRTCTRKDSEYTVFGFNLSYEFTQLFRDVPQEIVVEPEFALGLWQKCEKHKARMNFDCKDCYDPSELPDGTPFILNASNDKRYHFSVFFGRGKRRIRVIDAHAFFDPKTSLDSAAKMLGVGRKQAKTFKFTRSERHNPDFVKYAEDDARLTQRLGEVIMQWHRDYDVTMCVSAPQFASKVYRRKFLSAKIDLPHPQLEQYGLDSYHGGKNGYYRNRPQIVRNVYHVDIRSAYPEAMSQLPNPETSIFAFSQVYIRGVHALWRVRGTYTPCIYHPLYEKDGHRAKAGFVDTVITGYELDSILDHGELKLSSCEGYLMEGESGGSLVEYVNEFYAQKKKATDETTRTAAKLLLNSLYGKYFQKVALGNVGAIDLKTGRMIITNPEQDYDYQAGGLYHPPIASLITGFVRAKIHRLEHQYNAIMTSTDGFFSTRAPEPETIGNELGQLDSHKGTLKIWRERLYIFYPENCGIGRCFKKHRAYALHGWRGKVAELSRVPLDGGNLFGYVGSQMVTLKIAARTGGGTLSPGEFVSRDFDLKLAHGPDP